jgi:hypothetical protein
MQDPRMIKSDKLRDIVGIRAENDDHYLVTRQLGAPVGTPPQYFHLIGNTCP